MKTDELNNDAKKEDEGVEIKYNMCQYCKGIIPKYGKKLSTLTHCTKICSETNKMVGYFLIFYFFGE